jgi:hypothetical protein
VAQVEVVVEKQDVVEAVSIAVVQAVASLEVVHQRPLRLRMFLRPVAVETRHRSRYYGTHVYQFWKDVRN